MGAGARDERDLPALLEYLERCGRLMMAVLTGQESALSTLFPGGDFRTGDFLYSEWALARYFNGIVRGAVEAVVATLPPRRRLWAIELGAGTGGTTAAVLAALPAERTTYVYTDLSEAFFAQAGRNSAPIRSSATASSTSNSHPQPRATRSMGSTS